MNNYGKLEVFIPRNLLKVKDEIDLEVNCEGFSAVEINWENGFVSRIKSLDNKNSKPKQILLPRFVESHAHLDKSFSWKNFPNLKSNYENALSVNLQEHITRTSGKVINGAEKSIKLAISNGYRAIRTHIDTYNSQDLNVWIELFNLQEKYNNVLKLQFVSLAPLEFWNSSNGKLLAKKLKKYDGILGGVVVPPFNKRNIAKLLSNIILLANKYKLGIDFHIDESNMKPGAGIKVLLSTINKLNCKVPITCSHLSSILFLKEREISYLCNEIAKNKIKVVALPLTNFWLLNRDQRTLPLKRPIAPIKKLQESFVDVSIGGDNVQDSWYPFGNFDPLYLMSHSMPMMQLNPWERLTLSAFVTAPSRLLNLSWDGTIMEGCPADFVVLEGSAWADIFSLNLKRKILINGKWYKK